MVREGCLCGRALLLLLFMWIFLKTFGNKRLGLMEAIRNLASADEASVAQSRMEACMLLQRDCSASRRARQS